MPPAKKRKVEEVEDIDMLQMVFQGLGARMKERPKSRCSAFAHSQLSTLKCRVEKLDGSSQVTQSSICPMDGRPSWTENSNYLTNFVKLANLVQIQKCSKSSHSCFWPKVVMLNECQSTLRNLRIRILFSDSMVNLANLF